MNRPVLFLSIALLVLAVVVDQSAAGDDDDWEQYKKTFGKAYAKDSDGESAHKKSFLNSQQQIKEHNAAFARGESTFQLGLNHLSDLTPAEYSARNGYRRPKSGNANVASSASPFKPSMNVASSIPASVDWRQQGYVTPVKDQGQCGACWAFSATGALEGQLKRTTGQLVSLSEQNLVDCATNTWGCRGGWMDQAFLYVENNPGLDTESSYPYTATVNGTCKFSKANVGVTVSGWTDIASGSEAALQQAVATIGPISVAIDASQPSFQNYRQGVYYEPKCNSTSINHAVLVVGYGTDPTYGDYWLAKNSWGTGWGESGYIRMARNKNNNCAIATYASVPSTSTNKQCGSCTLNQLNIAGSSVVQSSITTNTTTGCSSIKFGCSGNIPLVVSGTNGNPEYYYCDTLGSISCATTLVCYNNGQWYTTYSMYGGQGPNYPAINAISCKTS